MRTPFNPMSDAAAEATRLAPAGRACSKFIWQSCFLKNWAVRMPAFGPPCLSSNHQCSRAYYESPQALAFCAALAIRPASIKIQARLKRGVACRTAGRRKRALFFHDTGSASSASAGHVVAAIGRHSSRPKCGGRRAANQRITVGALARWRFDGLAGPEFVSEFETKRDQ